MSATLDANLLLFASDEASPFHARARGFLDGLARGPAIVYVFWPVVMAYMRIATHASIFRSPLAPDRAMAKVESLLTLRHVQSPGEQDRFWPVFRDIAEPASIRGNLVPVPLGGRRGDCPAAAGDPTDRAGSLQCASPVVGTRTG